MKKLLNTLFVTTPRAYLHKDGETIQVQVKEKTKLTIPIHNLSSIVCFGVASCSTPLLSFCAERGVTVSFFSEQGKFQARVQGPVSGNVLLRRQQYRLADDSTASCEIARVVTLAKVANSRTVLQRMQRDHPQSAVPVTKVVNSLSHLIDELKKSRESLDVVRGREGEAARLYFSVFNHLIIKQKENFVFTTRSRRPPLDNINALLSFCYTLLLHDIMAALEGVGLDPAVGYLHRDRPGRPGLALDLMEEFRAFVGDRLVLSMVNLRQVRGKGFDKSESGDVRMDESTRRQVLVSYQTRKQDEILHPFIGQRIAIGLLFHVQALLMARFIRGDLDGYPPFIYK